MPVETPITAIYTDIGRGHPNYLDSVLRYIQKNYPEQYRQMRVTSIFEISRGISLAGWKMVQRMYRLGARGGIVSDVYGKLRAGQSEYDADSGMVKLLRRDLVRYVSDYSGICLVAHPLLANMLRGCCRVFYLHGEIAAPRESAVAGIEKVYVPLDETGRKMIDAGVDPGSIVNTGLVLEPEMCDNLETVVERRLHRINSSSSHLTIGLFISGAYPRKHIELMMLGARSLHVAGHRVRLFWGCDKKQVGSILSAVRLFDPDSILDDGSVSDDARTVIVTAESRMSETVKSMDYIPELDMFCAAPHERVNWAVGAGLPMIMITPAIGTFAPENLEFVLQRGCGIELSTRSEFMRLSDVLHDLKSTGKLAEMIEAGRRIESIYGAKCIAYDLVSVGG